MPLATARQAAGPIKAVTCAAFLQHPPTPPPPSSRSAVSTAVSSTPQAHAGALDCTARTHLTVATGTPRAMSASAEGPATAEAAMAARGGSRATWAARPKSTSSVCSRQQQQQQPQGRPGSRRTRQKDNGNGGGQAAMRRALGTTAAAPPPQRPLTWMKYVGSQASMV